MNHVELAASAPTALRRMYHREMARAEAAMEAQRFSQAATHARNAVEAAGSLPAEHLAAATTLQAAALAAWRP
jgi:hypothetical protein